MVDNVQPRSLSCFRIRKRRHDNKMDLRRTKTQEPLNMTWAGERREQPRSFQSPEMFFLLTLPFIERANRRSDLWPLLGRVTSQLICVHFLDRLRDLGIELWPDRFGPFRASTFRTVFVKVLLTY